MQQLKVEIIQDSHITSDPRTGPIKLHLVYVPIFFIFFFPPVLPVDPVAAFRSC